MGTETKLNQKATVILGIAIGWILCLFVNNSHSTSISAANTNNNNNNSFSDESSNYDSNTIILRKDSLRRLPSTAVNTNPSSKPIMHTFYQKVTEGEDELLDLWITEWSNLGFQTQILTLEDAKRHPYYQTMSSIVHPLFGESYNGLCFYRWLAMAQAGGGWMSDYDTFPTHFPLNEMDELPNRGEFTSFEAHVPSLMSGTANEWLRVTKLLVENVHKVDEFNLKTDMYAFKYIRDHFASSTNDSNNDSLLLPSHGVHFEIPCYHIKMGFIYHSPRKVDCKAMEMGRAVHLSHWKSRQAFDDGLYPTQEEEEEGQHNASVKFHGSKRATAAKIFLDDWRSQCGGSRHGTRRP